MAEETQELRLLENESFDVLLKNKDINEYVTFTEKETQDNTQIIDSENSKTVLSLDAVAVALLHVQGYTSVQIAKSLKVSTNVIQTLRKSTEYKNTLKLVTSEIINTARLFLSSSSMKAVRTLITCLDSPSEKIRLLAAKEVLDRVGLKSPDTMEILTTSSTVSTMTDEQLLQIIKLGQQELIGAGIPNG
jgi:DNA-binding CsgD family transcriptional regulator